MAKLTGAAKQKAREEGHRRLDELEREKGVKAKLAKKKAAYGGPERRSVDRSTLQSMKSGAAGPKAKATVERAQRMSRGAVSRQAGQVGRALAGRAGPVAAAGMVGAAVGKKIYDANATKIQDTLDKHVRNRGK